MPFHRPCGTAASDRRRRVEDAATDFRERYRVAGLLVIKGGKIVHEHYAFGHENYSDRNSDVVRFGPLRRQGEPALLRHLGARPRATEPGVRFHWVVDDNSVAENGGCDGIRAALAQ